MKYQKITDISKNFSALEQSARFIVRNYPVLPRPFNAELYYEDEQHARISVVGVGLMGARQAQILSRNLHGISCHEILSAPKGESCEQMRDSLYSICQCDLLFILTGFDVEHCEEAAQAIADAGKAAGALTLALLSGKNDMPPHNLAAQLMKHVDSAFTVTNNSLADLQEPLLPNKEALAGYAMRHMVTAITRMIHQRSLICVDFADIVKIMHEGNIGRLGVGISSGSVKGRNAARLALERLVAQEVTIFDATGVLVIIHGSSLFTMADYEDVSMVIHDHVAEDANIIVGFVTDDLLGYNVRVTVMPVQLRY